MIQGTTSHAGKSVITAAFCRIYARRGLRVAPFKAWNMALNSFATADGGEMGRAQVMQAQAAGIEPQWDMNPILLKPLGDSTSQVIVHGKPVGNMEARDYYACRPQVWKAVEESFRRLSDAFDVILIEGAGSPAEINLRESDIANMAVAKLAAAPVLLVADIDRGGVFATILGTLELLTPEERGLVSGVVINKFRGDLELLQPGLRMIEDRCRKPVLGVVPYLHGLLMEEEDSVALDEKHAFRPGQLLDVAVVRLPRISNFTDFLALEQEPELSVRYVDRPEAIGLPDLIILPGTKNTLDDLQFLWDSGLAERILELHRSGTMLIGICGGYQMLGRWVSDPHGAESRRGETPGLGLFPMRTALLAGKQLCQVEGQTTEALAFAPAGTPIRGYEIHAGKSTLDEPVPGAFEVTRRGGARAESLEGSVSGQDCFGTYVHGIFDSDEFRHAFIRYLSRRREGRCTRHDAPSEAHGETIRRRDELGFAAAREAAYDRLADAVQSSLNMEFVDDLLGLTR
jgi:adenosylcobyric acid synthase